MQAHPMAVAYSSRSGKYLRSPTGGHDVMIKSVPAKEIEFHADAMERFERAVKVVAKSPPQHRVTKMKNVKAKKQKSPK
jgi:hypothetical protein